MCSQNVVCCGRRLAGFPCRYSSHQGISVQEFLPFGDIGEPLKRCGHCGEWKPRSEFHKHRGTADGLQRNCKPCNIEIAKQFHAQNLEHCRERISKRSRLLRQENFVRLVEYLLEHPCTDCGETDPVVLEFDHLRDKEANVSALIHRPWRTVEEEIEKCEVVCANCHRRRTYQRQGSLRLEAIRQVLGER